MWVCRAGSSAVYFEKYITAKKIYLPWDGYKIDLSRVDGLQSFRLLVEQEKGTCNRTTISNWASQLFSFVYGMDLDDYVLIPAANSRLYCLAQITGQYEYNPNATDGLFHSRTIRVLEKDIPRTVFSHDIQYSLGAYRTVFKVKDEQRVVSQIQQWKKQSNRGN